MILFLVSLSALFAYLENRINLQISILIIIISFFGLSLTLFRLWVAFETGRNFSGKWKHVRKESFMIFQFKNARFMLFRFHKVFKPFKPCLKVFLKIWLISSMEFLRNNFSNLTRTQNSSLGNFTNQFDSIFWLNFSISTPLTKQNWVTDKIWSTIFCYYHFFNFPFFHSLVIKQ